jgi:hypothetical protein
MSDPASLSSKSRERKIMNLSNIIALIESIIGVAQPIIAAHIHNPKTQQVEATILTTVEGAAQIVAGVNAKAAAATPPATPPPTT